MAPSSKAPHTRPRVEGARESEILEAALTVLAQVGYDRLTMDGVAGEAKAGKATLYRRWSSKASLVVDALLHTKQALQSPEVDTGSLREDLLELACCHGGLTDERSTQVMAGVVAALQHDPEFAAEFRSRVLAPTLAATRAIFARARARGETATDLDLDLLSPALAGIVLHRGYVLGLPADEQVVVRIVDDIILPAATRPSRPTTLPSRPTTLPKDRP